MVYHIQSMKKKKVVIIDGNNNLYRAYYQFLNFSNFDGKPSGVIYGFLMMLISLLRKFKPTNVYVVFDGKRSSKRLSIHPNYKAGRDEKRLTFDKDSFESQKETLKRLLPLMGINVVHLMEHEADDVIYLLSKEYKRQEVYIVSRDKDFHQLISKTLSIWDSKEQVLLTYKNLKKRVGYNPSECVDYLCLRGDDSDNIQGYPGIGDKRGLDFINKFKYISRFLNSDEKFLSLDKSKLKELFEFNRQLIDIRLFCRGIKIDFILKKPELNLKKAKTILASYDIRILTIEENIKAINDYNERS